MSPLRLKGPIGLIKIMAADNIKPLVLRQECSFQCSFGHGLTTKHRQIATPCDAATL